MSLDPRIGVLNSGKFYCFPKGNGQPEFIGTREEVETILGIRPAVAKSAKIRRYKVTVTPKIATYAGSWRGEEYSVEVDAHNNSEAITKVRQQRNAEEGRYGVRATYRAQVIK